MISPELADALIASAAARRLLVASDFDGTLSPLVSDPLAAAPQPGAIATLSAIAALNGVDVVIVSGRSIEMLTELTGAPDGIRLIGTHGAQQEGEPLPDSIRTDVVSMTRALAAVADEYDGAFLEPKPVGAALHYRNAEDRAGAAEAAIRVGDRFGTRVLKGKEVVELVVGEGNKGTAIDGVRTRMGSDAIVFFGDDITDEDVFEMLGTNDVGVKVGSGPTTAEFSVADPAAVVEAIEMLLAARDLPDD
ncbi:MAG: trehalose-phosphatase [Acidimicrobiia bacterium]